MAPPRTRRRKGTKRGRRRVTINILPDNVLLDVFDCYMNQGGELEEAMAWQTLVHVCQKWRCVVFGSPRRLNLQLVCRPTSPVREMLDIWPPLPIVIWKCDGEPWPFCDVGDIVAALEHNDRITVIVLSGLPGRQLEQVLAVMQKPFPALTKLRLGSKDETLTAPVDLFLSGSAPGLQDLELQRIPFQGLPELLLSASHITDLLLFDIPHSGYISPEAMLTGISALTGLETIVLEFDYPQFLCPDHCPPPPTRTLLPALICMEFNGESEYLGYLVAGIDAPLLETLDITFYPQLSFHTPQITEFISRTPGLNLHDEAHISFLDEDIHLTFPRPFCSGLRWQISCSDADWMPLSKVQICASSICQAIGPLVKFLYIFDFQEYWEVNIGNEQWLDLLRPFNALKDLYLSSDIIDYIAPALYELAEERERVTEVLPGLQNLFLEFHELTLAQNVLGRFIAARQLAGHPMAVSQWD